MVLGNSPVFGEDRMNRRNFLSSICLSCLALVMPKLNLPVMGKVRNCLDCRKSTICCEVLQGEFAISISVWEKDILIKQGELKGVEVGRFEDFAPGVLAWRTGSKQCPFLKNKRCLIYDKRPGVCRKYYCDDWDWTKVEQDSINRAVDREWNEKTCNK